MELRFLSCSNLIEALLKEKKKHIIKTCPDLSSTTSSPRLQPLLTQESTSLNNSSLLLPHPSILPKFSSLQHLQNGSLKSNSNNTNSMDFNQTLHSTTTSNRSENTNTCTSPSLNPCTHRREAIADVKSVDRLAQLKKARTEIPTLNAVLASSGDLYQEERRSERQLHPSLLILKPQEEITQVPLLPSIRDWILSML